MSEKSLGKPAAKPGAKAAGAAGAAKAPAKGAPAKAPPGKAAAGKPQPKPEITLAKPAKAGLDLDASAFTTDALSAVVTRNVFYRDGYRTLLRVALAQGVAIGVMCLGILFVVLGLKPKLVYFATAQDGSILQLRPFNEPGLTNEEVVAWTSAAVRDAMTFNHKDYRERLQYAERHFTQSGWASFTKQLLDSKMLQLMQQNRWLIKAQPRTAPAIVDQGVPPQSGIYVWKIVVELEVARSENQSDVTEVFDLQLLITRTSSLDTDKGIAIEQWLQRRLDAAGRRT